MSTTVGRLLRLRDVCPPGQQDQWCASPTGRHLDILRRHGVVPLSSRLLPDPPPFTLAMDHFLAKPADGSTVASWNATVVGSAPAAAAGRPKIVPLNESDGAACLVGRGGAAERALLCGNLPETFWKHLRTKYHCHYPVLSPPPPFPQPLPQSTDQPLATVFCHSGTLPLFNSSQRDPQLQRGSVPDQQPLSWICLAPRAFCSCYLLPDDASTT